MIRELLRYKAWANDLLYAALAKLPEGELAAPRPIVFGSILRTLNHVYAMDQVWQANLEGRAHGFTTRNPPASPPFFELREAQKRIDAWYIGLYRHPQSTSRRAASAADQHGRGVVADSRRRQRQAAW